jgi:hypothetical protein
LNLRNSALALHAFYMRPHRGPSSGITRTTEAAPDIKPIDDQCGNQFKAIVRRPIAGPVTDKQAWQVIPPSSKPADSCKRGNIETAIDGYSGLERLKILCESLSATLIRKRLARNDNSR